MEMEALGIQPDVKQRDHHSHCDQDLQKEKERRGGTRRILWGSTADLVQM